MIRQAHSYLLGAMSGAALLAAAIAVFVVLVSLQAFQDWPISGLGAGAGDTTSVAPGRPAATRAASTGGAPAWAVSRRSARSRAAGPSRQAAAGGKSVGLGAAAPGAGAPSSSPGGGGGSASSPSGGGSSGGAPGAGGRNGNSPGATATNTVEETASQVDHSVGSALGKTTVTEAAQGVVEGVAGPESTVGKAVNETVGAVGGLLHPNH